MPDTSRKSVDLDEEVVAALRLGAATKNVSVKKYMESVLSEKAELLKRLKVADLLKTTNPDR